ncbi:MAG: hypothetical protein AAF637_22120 [Pseudomonadota bacterium]
MWIGLDAPPSLRTFMLATASALALSLPANAQTGEGDPVLTDCDGASECLDSALEGLVDGFTGQAGSDLWGWMLGGSQSAGTAAIKNELDTIESTLTTIENELGPDGPIVRQLQKLQCAEDSDWIAAGPATAINSWYDRYQDFLTDLQSGAEPSLGAIDRSNTDVTTLYGWANGVIQGNANVAANDVLTSMISLNNLSVTNSSSGTIADCIKANGSALGVSLDDRPYYENNVLPIQNYLLNLNAQAMIVLTEAYHIYAYGECVTANGGDPSQCTSNNANEVVPNLCPANSKSTNCVTPITIYGRLGSSPSGQFLPFVHTQFKAGGAPYSTDEYLMVNTTETLLVRSIESYNTAAGANCPDPVAKPCGPTVGPSGSAMTSVAVGPYGYGGGANDGKWTPASAALFSNLLNQGFNNVQQGTVSVGRFLCTMSLSGGDVATCTQSNGGAGLQNVAGKGIYFPDTLDYGELGTFRCFVDGDRGNNLLSGTSPIHAPGQPFCSEPAFSAILPYTITVCPFVNAASLENVTMGVYPGYYNALYCNDEGWQQTPGYRIPGNPSQYFQWPTLDWTELVCSNGKAPNDASNLNPAAIPTLCGKDFDTWFNARVPAGPAQPIAVADTTLDRSTPNRNDGVNPRLTLFGRQQRAVIAFDPDELQASLDQNALESARLVLSSADRSATRANIRLLASPLEATFVEGNGNRDERDRGSGSGATYACAEDAEIADFRKECLQDWPWRFDRKRGDRRRVPDGFTGKIIFDVTHEVEAGVSAFLVKRLGGGSMAFHSREGAAHLDDLSLVPSLILIPAEDEVAQAE